MERVRVPAPAPVPVPGPEPVRILHLLDHSIPRHSAYARRTMAILRQQRAMGWHTTQLTGPRQGLSEPDRNRDGWHFFRTAPAAGVLARMPLLGAAGVIARRLRKVVQLTRPDLLHAHSPAENALAALRVGRRLGLPVVFEVHAVFGHSDRTAHHALRHALARAAERWCAGRVDAVTTSSEGLRAQLEAGGVRRARVTVVPNAVDLRDYPPAPRRDIGLARQLGLRGGPVLGFIGAFHRYEGVELLIDALPALLRLHPQLQLLLAGPGAQQDWLKARVLRHGLQRSVVFSDTALVRPAAHDADNAQDTHAALHALADVLVFPRLPQRAAELVPAQRLLEAMARGCLVVASSVGSHRELVDHGRTGMLFEAGKADALADAVNVLLAAPARWPAMRGEARWFVEYQRSWEVSVGRYGPLYRRLLGQVRR
jgi:glycogen(starch) synthase